MIALRRLLRSLHDWGSRVPVLAPAVQAADRLHLRLVAKERYEGFGAPGRDYLEQYAAVILPKTHGRVLDLGCGHGYVAHEIARRLEVDEVVAIDKISEFHCVHPKITYRTQDLAADPRLPGGFDVVVATEFIEHIPEAAFLTLLPAIRDALREGGLFIGSTPPNPTAADTFSGSPYHCREYQPPVLRAHLDRYFTEVLLEQHGEAFMTWEARRPGTG